MNKKDEPRKRKYRERARIIGLFLILTLVFTVSTVEATIVKVEPATQTLTPGTNFSVNVTVENVTFMAGDQATVNFDPTAMTASSIIEGDFLKSAGSTLSVTTINNPGGYLDFSYVLLSIGAYVNGSGVLATINFNTNASAECTFHLNLTNVILSNTSAGAIPIDAIYNGTVKLDNTSPTVEIISPLNDSWFDSEPVNVTFHLWDAKAEVLNYSVFLDDGEVANGTALSCNNTTIELGMLSECNHVIRVNATDDVGLEGTTEVTIHVDLTPPTVQILAPTNSTWLDSEPFNLTFLPRDNKADVLNYSIFDGAVEIANGTTANGSITNVTIDPAVLGDCDHEIRVNVTDQAGKMNSSSVTLHVDLTPPTVEILSPANDSWFDSEPFNLSFQAWDNKAALINYTIFDGAVELVNGTAANGSITNVTIDPAVLGDCDHVIRVAVSDYVEKTNSSDVTIHVDLTPPTVEILSPANDSWFDSEPVIVTFRPWDNKAATLNYSIFVDSIEKANGTAANDSTVEVNLSYQQECNHVIRVNVTDYVGKTNFSEVTVHVDLTPPTVEILLPANDSWFKSEPFNLSFLAIDNKADILNYSIFDGATEIANGTAVNGTITNVTINPAVLGDCDNTLRVNVSDKVGKANNSASITIHVDSTPPVVEIIAPANDSWFDSEPFNLSFRLTDNKATTLNYSVFDGDTEIENGTAANGTLTNLSLSPFALGDCDHVIRVNASDTVGETNSSSVMIHIDLIPPTVAILAPANGSWFDSEPVNVTFQPCDNKAATLNYSIFVDNDEKANGTADNCSTVEVNLSYLPECTHVIRVNVTDYVGKTNFSEVTVHVDLTPPTVEILWPMNDSWFDSEPFNLSFQTRDNKAALINYSIFDGLTTEIANGTTVNGTITNVTINPAVLGDCDHVIRVTVSDYVGKTNSSEVTIHVDLTPPSLEVIAPANDSWFDSGNVTVSFRIWDNKAETLNYTLYLDNATQAGDSVPNGSMVFQNLTGVPECDHIITIAVTDQVDKTNTSNITIHVDLTPPTIEILAPANDSWFKSDPFNLSFILRDNKADSLTYSVFEGATEIANGTAVNGTIANVTIDPPVLGDGDHVLRVNATDKVNRTNSSSLTIHVDSTPPVVEILAPANDSWFDSEEFNLSFRLTDNKADNLNYSIFDGETEIANGTAANGTITNFTLDPAVLGDCNHVLRVNATDTVGETNSSSIFVHIDLTPPTVEIIAPANGTWFDSEPVNVTFHLTDNKAATINYSVFVDSIEKANGTAANDSTVEVNLSYQPECEYVIRVNVTDYVGKTNFSEVTVHVDLTPPTVEIIAPVNGTWFDSEDVNVTFHACDNKADLLNYSIFVDGNETANGTAVNCTNESVNLGPLPDCNHTIRVEVRDRADKTNSSEVTIHVDRTPPIVEILAPVNGTWFDSEPVNVTFQLWDNKAATLNYSVFVDGVEKTNGTAANGSVKEVPLGILPECEHVIRVNATDYVGKTNFSEVTVHVDLTPPTVEIISPVNGTWFDSEDLVVTFHPWDNKAATLNYSIFVNGLEQANGTAANCTNKTVNLGVLSDECDNVIRVNVTDYVDKTNFSEVTVRVDLTKPIVTIVSPGEGQIIGKVCVNLNFTAEDLGACPSGIDENGTYYVLDGGAPVNITGNTTVGGLDECNHTIVLYVTDNVGKVNSTTVNFVLHPGDIRVDLQVNVLDLQRLAWAFLSEPGDGSWNPAADLNCDNVVNIFDLQILAWNYLKDYSIICS